MDIIETIAAHATALQRPLYAVTASAIRKADTPLILTLHWHGFHRGCQAGGAPRPVAGSAVQLNLRWHDFAVLDRAIVDAGWALGAWDVERIARPPWWRLNAPAAEALAGHRAFADYSGPHSEADAVVVEAPDQQTLVELAARKGYVRWLFRPRKGGLWRLVDGDDCTLQADGGRVPPCPVPLQAEGPELRRNVIYRLGRGHGLWTP
ncbi:MAG: diguanylate cyclase [Achromobacter sp.]|uniref:diguanylate cyclase n=1 Tax=Achromobacter sp. TaxID=134375 RepID=UPI003D0829C3